MSERGYQPSHDIPAPNFKKDLAYGEEGEQIVQQFLVALEQGSFEVKRDRYRNGRMVVETNQNPRNEGWKKSGINVTEAAWWVYIFSDDAFVVVGVNRLKNFLRRNGYNEEAKRLFAGTSDNPAKGFLLMPEHVQDLLINDLYD
jgi:hypothetical protein